MKRSLLASGLVAIGLTLAMPAVAQNFGPAKTPNGSMPAAPSSNMPSSGTTMTGPNAGMRPGMGMRRPSMHRRMRHRRMMHHRRMHRGM